MRRSATPAWRNTTGTSPGGPARSYAIPARVGEVAINPAALISQAKQSTDRPTARIDFLRARLAVRPRRVSCLSGLGAACAAYVQSVPQSAMRRTVNND